SLHQHIGAEKLVLQDAEQFATSNQVTVMPHTRVQCVDVARCVLITTHGEISYDRLVLAVGSTPIPYPWFESHPTLISVNHLDDYQRLFMALQGEKKRVLIIGAGLVGVELAHDC